MPYVTVGTYLTLYNIITEQAVREADEEDAGPGSHCDVELTRAATALQLAEEGVQYRLK